MSHGVRLVRLPSSSVCLGLMRNYSSILIRPHVVFQMFHLCRATRSKKTSTPLQLSVPGVSKRAINHRWIILSRSSAEAICLCLACSLCLCTHCNQRFCIFWMKFCKLICSKKQKTLSVAFKAKFKQVFDN